MIGRDVSSFIDATANDANLQSEWNAAATPQALAAVGERHGFTFDVSELESALEGLQKLHAGELHDADLDRVVGGATRFPDKLSLPATTQLQFYESWPCKWLGEPK